MNEFVKHEYSSFIFFNFKNYENHPTLFVLPCFTLAEIYTHDNAVRNVRNIISVGKCKKKNSKYNPVNNQVAIMI